MTFRYLLDTNVLSEIRKIKNGRANTGVVQWAQTANKAELCVSVITVLELEKGCLLKQRHDPQQGSLLLHWFETVFLPEFADKTLPVNTEIARLCARLHVPDKKPQFDSLIAATALHHDLILLTRNTKDFSASGVKLFNPFSS
nr:type II toxin-antitoxin system VapC family toxin [Conchiformibius kuhniae]